MCIWQALSYLDLFSCFVDQFCFVKRSRFLVTFQQLVNLQVVLKGRNPNFESFKLYPQKRRQTNPMCQFVCKALYWHLYIEKFQREKVGFDKYQYRKCVVTSNKTYNGTVFLQNKKTTYFSLCDAQKNIFSSSKTSFHHV